MAETDTVKYEDRLKRYPAPIGHVPVPMRERDQLADLIFVARQLVEDRERVADRFCETVARQRFDAVRAALAALDQEAQR